MLCIVSYTAGSTLKAANVSAVSTSSNSLPAALWYVLCVGDAGVSLDKTFASTFSDSKSSRVQSCQKTTDPRRRYGSIANAHAFLNLPSMSTTSYAATPNRPGAWTYVRIAS